MIENNSLVNYTGKNLTEFIGKSGRVITFNAPKTSAFVQFKMDDGAYESAWVGLGALSESFTDPPMTAILESLRTKLKEKQMELDKATKLVDTLDEEIDKIIAVIQAINELG